MPIRTQLLHQIFSVRTDDEFNLVEQAVKEYQIKNNPVYKTFANSITQFAQPGTIFLPIRFFKTHRVSCHDTEEAVFASSGTTGTNTSRHFIYDIEVYRQSFLKAFTMVYGSPHNLCILALLPSYLERQDSSLVYMANDLIKKSNFPESGFFLNEYETLYHTLLSLQDKRIPTLLLGVSFALLEFSGQFPISFPDLIVMETGGMKGKGREMVRDELHRMLQYRFGVPAIHSEYGMTELFSQAYSKGNGIFMPPRWMRVSALDISDPLSILPPGRRGRLAFTDLANIDSCAFIATDDLGTVNDDGTFTVEGRLDDSDIRGCNLLYN